MTLAADVTSAAEVHTLYVHHHGWLKGWLRRKLGCSHTAADLAHDTFLRVLLAAHGQALREPRAYLTTIARNLLVDHKRRTTLEQAWLDALAALPEPVAPPPEERLMLLETLHQVDKVLCALPPAVRTSFLLSQVEGLKYADIARQLGISERTVKRHMLQAFEHCILLA